MKKYLILTLFIAIANISTIGSNANTAMSDARTFHTVDVKPEYDFNKFYLILEYFKVNLDNDSLFFSNLITTSKILGVEPDWLLKIICHESRANPKAKNPFSNATGIIQWLPSTALDLGTTVDEIYHMSIDKQFELSIKYFRRVNTLDKVSSYEDLYLSVFYPKAVGKPDDFVIGDYGSKLVSQNRIMANNGRITVADFKRYAKVDI